MRKDLIVAVLCTFCLTVTLFTIIPSRSQTEVQYDPWYDLNDDGKIDILDVVLVTNKYGTTGTPINKTELLLELQAKIDTLNASLRQLQDRVSIAEEEMNQVKTIRFVEINESKVEERGVWIDAATFIWTPNNITNNAILSGILYMKWMGGIEREDYYFRWFVRILINGIVVWNVGCAAEIRGNQTSYIWTPIMPFEVGFEYSYDRHGVTPNQESYTITVQVGKIEADASWYLPAVSLNVRNINVIITVVDGLPASG